MQSHAATAGEATARQPTPEMRDDFYLTEEQRADVEFGFRIAKEGSRLEIGQLVVVKEGTVLAVEGFEGTDKCLARGGELAGKNGGAVAVKVAKLNHDMRFDVPTIGPKTSESMRQARGRVRAVEANKTIIVDQADTIALADRLGITIVAR